MLHCIFEGHAIANLNDLAHRVAVPELRQRYENNDQTLSLNSEGLLAHHMILSNKSDTNL